MNHSRYMKMFSVILLVFSMLICLRTPSEAMAQKIRVGLTSNTASLSLSSTSSYTLTDARGNKLAIKGTLRLSGRGSSGTVKINSKTYQLPLTLSGKGFMIFDKRKYRGTFRIIRGTSGLTLINVIGIEDYLRGVLKMEVNPAWPEEALKTQAIISRTYAFKHMNRHSKEGFDVCALPHCQVYRGVNAEDPLLDRVIKGTEGLVVTYNGNLALTPFQSDSGGATADVKTVWGGNIPYLKAVKEPSDYVSPYASWKISISAGEIQKALLNKGVNIGTVTGIEVAGYDPFGRVNSIRITGTGGVKLISSHSFRMAIGARKMKSTMFEISSDSISDGPDSSTNRPSNLETPAPRLSFVDERSPELNPEEEKLITVLTRQGFFSADQMIDMLLHPEKKKSYLVTALNRNPGKYNPVKKSSSLHQGSGFVLKGSGWGHGVGLSQWGAKNLAEKGWKKEQIISHYYPGTKIRKFY